jgi:hypothetical protein
MWRSKLLLAMTGKTVRLTAYESLRPTAVSKFSIAKNL